MRLTAELVAAAPVYMNPIKLREINLRGFKIPAIENLGVTQDEFEVIDLSDNDITKIENIPLLNRLSMLLLSNNRISKIGMELHRNMPNLETLILCNNRLSSLSDLDPLIFLSSSLRTLSLMHNPIARRADYRSYVIHLLPKLAVLDFQKVKPKERDAAVLAFGPPPTPESLLAASTPAPVVTPEKPLPGQAVPHGQAISLSTAYAQPASFTGEEEKKQQRMSQAELDAEKKRLVALIQAATNLEEVNKLQKQLETLIANNA